MDGEGSLEDQEVAIEVRGDGAGGATVSSKSASKSAPAKPRRGRPRGVPNKVNRIAKEAITKAEPHSFLIRVMEGRKFKRAGTEGAQRTTACYPTLTESISAAETLLRKIAPDLKSQELSGPGGSPLLEPTRREGLQSRMELARSVAFVLAQGDDAKRKLAEMDAPEIATEPVLAPKPVPEPEPVTEAPEPSGPPPDPPLPAHAYIFLEEGERERSGERAWLAMEGRQVLNTFHGADARQKARDWIGTKFGASPAKEVEIPLPEREAV